MSTGALFPRRHGAPGIGIRSVVPAMVQADVWVLLGCAAAGTATNLVACGLPLSAAWVDLPVSILELVPVLVLVRFARRRIEEGHPLSLGRLVLGTAVAAGVGAVFTVCRGPFTPMDLVGAGIGMSLPCALFVGALELHARAARADARAHETRETNIRLEAELQQARARLLEAQIEPHFLFNTLANVRQLQRSDPGAGVAMLGDLIQYLETSLPSLRSESTTLDRERALVAAYLRLHRPRFGSRLRFDISFPEPLLGCVVPSMMLLTLVENSLKHGLSPLPDGGSIQLFAERSGGSLLLTVADTGAGMRSGIGGGMGLANIRSRLRLRYGDRARLNLSLNEPRGVRASLQLPLAAEPST